MREIETVDGAFTLTGATGPHEDDGAAAALAAILEEAWRERRQTPGASLAFLQQAGLLDADGQISRDYRGLVRPARTALRKRFTYVRLSKLKHRRKAANLRHGQRAYA
jgi:hypothetical protein